MTLVRVSDIVADVADNFELNGYQAGVLVDRLIDPYRDDDDFNEVVDD